MLFIVRGQPLPTVRFLYRDVELPQTEYIRMEAEVYRDSLEGCLIFKTPTHHNNGNYTLEARNSLGVAYRTVDAHFMGAPYDGRNISLSLCWSKNQDGRFNVAKDKIKSYTLTQLKS